MTESTEDTRRQERLQKVNDLKALGSAVYPYTYDVTATAKSILDKHSNLAPQEKTEDAVSIAGRIMTMRTMGKIVFAHVQDETGKIQVFFRQNDLGDSFEKLQYIERGDIIGVKGTVFSTKAGETTVWVTDFDVLCKSLRDLPEKYHGLKDTELRYRQRYLDLTMNRDVFDVFTTRSKIVKAVRDFFDNEGFMEVETPLLQTQYGGASARPFKTHINAWDMDVFLSISPELYLKRLLVGGYTKVFTICKNFRNEGVDHSHSPEFTMLEAYQAFTDYHGMMDLLERCYDHVCTTVFGTTKLDVIYRDNKGQKQTATVDFKAPWPKQTLADAIKEHVGVDVLSMSVEELTDELKKHKIALPDQQTWGSLVMELFDELVEDKIIQPTHIIDRPRESSPLCKVHREDERLIEQDEPVGAGMELGNIYSELNDGKVQRELLEGQANQLRGGDDEAHPMDEDFARCIELGMPPAGGLGFGIDRMVLLLTGQATLRDIILFPIMRPQTGEEPTDEASEEEK